MVEKPYVTKTGMSVDPARLKRNGETLLFTPFLVEGTRALADVLAADEIPADMDLLLAARGERCVIALSRQQMAYHHVAQGTADGEPWLVFF